MKRLLLFLDVTDMHLGVLNDVCIRYNWNVDIGGEKATILLFSVENGIHT